MNTFHIEKLDDSNYDSWKILMESLLIQNDYWDYVNQTIIRPVDVENGAKWDRNDSKAKACIILTLKPSQLLHIKYCKTANDVWTKLKEIHQPKTPCRKVALIKKLVTLKCGNSENLKIHVDEFFEILDKLKELSLDIPEEICTILLLCSLPENFENFRIAMETREILPKLNNLKIKIIEEHEHRHKTEKEANNSEENLLKTEKRYSYKKLKCFNCGLTGHTSNKCRNKKKNNNERKQACKVTQESTYCMFKNNLNDEMWCMDSGATSHICNERSCFVNFKTVTNMLIKLATEDEAKVEGIGDVHMTVKVGNRIQTINLKDVLYVPNIRGNILSIPKITENGGTVKFKNKFGYVISKENLVTIKAIKKNGLYVVKGKIETAKFVTSSRNNFKKWHERFGHLNFNSLKYLKTSNIVEGLNFDSNTVKLECDICLKGKQTATKFPKESETKCQDLLEIVHSDICGPMESASFSGMRYFITFIDDKSRMVYVDFLKFKHEALKAFKDYKNLVENETGHKIKILRSDNGGEYCNNKFKEFLKQNGIKHQLTAPYTPQQNGVAERANRTLVESARCMMLQAKLPTKFWAEAIETASFIRNRCSTKILGDNTPFQIWYGRKPNVSFLKTFGCKAFALNKKPNKRKFEQRSWECVFVGYSLQSKAYRLWNPKNNRLIITRDVKFSENFENTQNKKSEEVYKNIPNKSLTWFTMKNLNNGKNEEKQIYEENTNLNIENELEDEEIREEQVENQDLNLENYARSNNEERNNDNSSTILKRKAGRPKIIRTGKKGRPKKEFNLEEINITHLEKEPDPENVEEALASNNSKNWKQAMEEEYNSIIENQTWELIDPPKDRQIIGCKWVLRTKYNSDGSISRYKARLVAKGYTQQEGIDFNDTYAPVVRIGSIRLILALAAEYRLRLHQMDVKCAYLNGDLTEEIYMEQPKLYVKKGMENKVCRLKKSLYGLRQSGREWNKKLESKLISMRFTKCFTDECVYIRRQKSDIIIIAVYVDDLILAGSNDKIIKSVKQELMEIFQMKDEGPIHYCLGIAIKQEENGSITISQAKYISDILNKFDMSNCKSVGTPLDANTKLRKGDPNNKIDVVDRTTYQSIIGSLMFLATSTRPDIAYTVSALSQFNSDPRHDHMIAAKRVLRYVHGTANFALKYEANGKSLIGFTDADWGNDINDRKSYTGYIFMLAGGAISWQAQKQRSVALSSTEAEYMAITQAVKEAIYLKSFLKELNLGNYDEKIEIYNDNQSAMKLIKNNVYHGRSKHIDIQYHFSREAYERGIINVNYIPTENMVADIMTKALFKIKHERCIKDFGFIKNSM